MIGRWEEVSLQLQAYSNGLSGPLIVLDIKILTIMSISAMEEALDHIISRVNR